MDNAIKIWLQNAERVVTKPFKGIKLFTSEKCGPGKMANRLNPKSIVYQTEDLQPKSKSYTP